MRTRALGSGAWVPGALLRDLRSPGFLPDVYPALGIGGVPEGAFHSYVVSALVLLGDRLGYSPISDSPLFDKLDAFLVGESLKRPDAVWFERGSESAQVLVEFERYAPGSLLQKARHLLAMGRACADSLRLLVLIYWTTVPRTDADLAEAREAFARGVSWHGSRFGPAACPALIVEVLVARRDDRLRLSSVVLRAYVEEGEDKRHVVDELNA